MAVIPTETRCYHFGRSDTISITMLAGGIRQDAMDRNHVTDDDQGKAVVDSMGQTIGMVTEVRSGTAYVDADPGLTDTIRSKLGWGGAGKDDYPLEEERIHTITDDEIRLKDEF